MVTVFFFILLCPFYRCFANDCVNGTYGSGCTKKCGHCLNMTQCHQKNGTCLYGCEPGYRGFKCNKKCKNNTYGVNCSMTCGNCYRKKQCHHISGKCTKGCTGGFQKPTCNKECNDNTFGRNCKIKCGQCLNKAHCNPWNGTCMNGCASGFQRPKCKNCIDGKYGKNCEKNCSINCRNPNKCYRSGKCSGGCRKGWTGNDCNTECPDGTFGLRCTERCSTTCNSCNKSSGICEFGCKIGWKGDFCETECSEGYFGLNCKKRCKQTCNSCNKVSGICEYGCKPGWKGNLCETECPDGYFGPNCQRKCNENCHSSCNKESGICEYGCQPGWKGDFCETECFDGFYGENCSRLCGYCFQIKKCHHETGVCSEGCEPGYRGNNCNKECDGGFFGHNCNSSCGHCLREHQCHYMTGMCSDGCEAGYTGENCNKECDSGFFGVNCSTPCGHCLRNTKCHHLNGTCLEGCEPGYIGNSCTEECLEGYFGLNCKKRCNETCNSCNKVSGVCEYGCKPGWKGNLCETECPDGYFGPNCESKCNENCHSCNKTSGVCEYGCQPGWRGDFCETECFDGVYGENCSRLCGHCFEIKKCHHETGVCSEGCEPGYRGNNCIKECDGGFFGVNCSTPCGHCLREHHCHYITGMCSDGCEAGYTGENCNKECDRGFFGVNCSTPCGHCLRNTKCHHLNGTCLEGCEPGYIWRGCTEVCNNNMYGENCNQKCGNCANSSNCNHVNGSCPSGCDLGFQGPLCTDECSNGRFGYNCMDYCSSLCLDGHCDKKSGTCKKVTSNADSQRVYGDTAPFIGVGVGVFVIIIAAVILVFAVSRYQRGKTKHKKIKPSIKIECGSEMKVTGQENGSMINDENETAPVYDGISYILPDDSNYSNVFNKHFDITVYTLEIAIAEKRRNGNEGFKTEYAALPSGELHKCEFGKKPENVPKNRYKTTFPYDHSRVVLEISNGEKSDYINANFIDGANRKKEYIATQGPKPNTLGDFWRMIWQENVTSIVMVTTLVEGEKVKCSKYWPDKDKPTIYGPVQVTFIKEKEYACFTTRQLSVIDKELNTCITRVVTQYHYTAWPDHGVPEPLCLLTFHNHVVHTSANNNQGPTIVHCSAGVGRTGTYIALDVLVQIGKRTGKVNVAEFVAKMRQNRVSMVQTYEQYMTIYLSLNEIFKAPIEVNTMVEFLDKAEKSRLYIPHNENSLNNEFQFLLKIRQNYGEDDYIFETNDSGDQLSGEILPLKKYCLYLSPSVTTPGNYINAITVPSYTNLQRFIVTRYPLEEKAVDLFRLLSDQESDTIISLEPLREIESIKAWLPSESSSIAIPPFTVYHRSKSHTDVISHEIQIVHNDAGVNTVMVVEPDVEIQCSRSPVDTSQLRSLVSTVLHLETKQPITILSSDGASMCGMFIAIHNVIQQMNMDDRVDVFTAVRQLQIRRPEFCARIEDYETIYQAVMDHYQIASENIYCNQ